MKPFISAFLLMICSCEWFTQFLVQFLYVKLYMVHDSSVPQSDSQENGTFCSRSRSCGLNLQLAKSNLGV